MIIQTCCCTDVVIRSNTWTILASIGNIWYSGKNCASAQTWHNINITQYFKPISEDTLNAKTRLYSNSKIYDSLQIILISSPNTQHIVYRLASNWSIRDDILGVKIRAICNSPCYSLLQANPLCVLNLSSRIAMVCHAQVQWSYNSCPNTIEFQCGRELHEHQSCTHHCMNVVHTLTVMQSSPALKVYGIWARIGGSST